MPSAWRPAAIRKAISTSPSISARHWRSCRRQREVLIMVGATGLSYEEAADICGVAIGTIKSRVNRARTKLAELLSIGSVDDLGPDRTGAAAMQRVGSEPVGSDAFWRGSGLSAGAFWPCWSRSRCRSAAPRPSPPMRPIGPRSPRSKRRRRAPSMISPCARGSGIAAHRARCWPSAPWRVTPSRRRLARDAGLAAVARASGFGPSSCAAPTSAYAPAPSRPGFQEILGGIASELAGRPSVPTWNRADLGRIRYDQVTVADRRYLAVLMADARASSRQLQESAPP